MHLGIGLFISLDFFSIAAMIRAVCEHCWSGKCTRHFFPHPAFLLWTFANAKPLIPHVNKAAVLWNHSTRDARIRWPVMQGFVGLVIGLVMAVATILGAGAPEGASGSTILFFLAWGTSSESIRPW